MANYETKTILKMHYLHVRMEMAMTDVTVLWGSGQGFCDDSTEVL